VARLQSVRRIQRNKETRVLWGGFCHTAAKLRGKSENSLSTEYNDIDVQGDQKISVHLMITVQKVTSNVQSVARQSPDIYFC
jgi:hypothetical protein